MKVGPYVVGGDSSRGREHIMSDALAVISFNATAALGRAITPTGQKKRQKFVCGSCPRAGVNK